MTLRFYLHNCIFNHLKGHWKGLYFSILLHAIFILGIPHVVILTNIDKICCLENDNVQKFFTNGLVETAVSNTARVIGLPRSHVLPVKNYEKETQLKTNINILALIALRRLLMFADDYLENQYDQEQENAQI